jgi:curved DNA-binding protein CbpA
MPVTALQLTELKRAYQILGVPLSASAHSIKHTYRRLVKRWHPDLYSSGTVAYREATQMTRLINEAYSTIEHAPLRYHIEANPLVQKSAGRATRTSADESNGKSAEAFPKTDRLEFWVRFVCGAVFGAFVSFRLVLDFFEHPAILVLGIVGVMLGFGFAAARYGDKVLVFDLSALVALAVRPVKVQ